jgi:alanyl-tRNA synthetase
MGLERLAIVVQGADSIFDIDTLKAIRSTVLQLTKGKDEPVSVNIITDHARSVTFMAADGVLPSNEGRGYVLRRLLRRAVRHGKTLGIDKAFMGEVAQRVIETHSHAYPELAQKKEHIIQVLSLEESRFLETLDMGLIRLQKEIDNLQTDTLSGAEAFKLYDTYGFPLELMTEILQEKGLKADEQGFRAEMDMQKTRARSARGASSYSGADESIYDKLPHDIVTSFCGYDILQKSTQTTVVALIANGEIVQQARAGQQAAIFLRQTPFYTEGGGQKGDSGDITADGLQVSVKNCINVTGGHIAHIGDITEGTLRVGDTVTVAYNPVLRKSITCHHSATHLLQKALREVLGEHVEQAGSEVSSDRLRFDFTHVKAMTPEERDTVERIVNEKIIEGLYVAITETTPEEARKMGAMALFGEKYGDTVRMVSINDTTENYSVELCGGTHVGNTMEIGAFKLVSESGIAAGVRRIEAVTRKRAVELFRESAAVLAEIAEQIKAPQGELPARIAALAAENKELKKAAERAKAEATKGQTEETAAALVTSAITHKGFLLITAKLEGYDIEGLRTLSDKIKAAPAFLEKGGCLLLAAVAADSVQFLASASDNAVKAGIHAGNIIKAAAQHCGGSGGGRPNHAQAGGKDAQQADTALAAGLEMMKAV